uniref:Putative ovule protein n=1 Tax=Solanum chacoense TaxID=4108 RepID=A0A0V0GY04_SOLCH
MPPGVGWQVVRWFTIGSGGLKKADGQDCCILLAISNRDLVRVLQHQIVRFENSRCFLLIAIKHLYTTGGTNVQKMVKSPSFPVDPVVVKSVYIEVKMKLCWPT